MLRKLLSRLLRADLEPVVRWHEAEAATPVARMFADCPRVFGGTERFEQVLLASGERYSLFSRWTRSGKCARVEFTRPFNGQEMRVCESQPGSEPVHRLQLSPRDAQAVTYTMSQPVWFGLWRNEVLTGLGPGVCFIDSNDREQLVQLRATLLEGEVPQSLLAEEEMWQRMNSLSPEQRRAAMVAMMTQSLAAADRQFDEQFPDHGPVPDDLRPAFDAIQQRIGQIQQSVAGQEVDPELRGLMQQFVDRNTRPPA